MSKIGGIVTFAKSVDDLFGTGIPTGKITEFVGAPGTGKSQLWYVSYSLKSLIIYLQQDFNVCNKLTINMIFRAETVFYQMKILCQTILIQISFLTLLSRPPKRSLSTFLSTLIVHFLRLHNLDYIHNLFILDIMLLLNASVQNLLKQMTLLR